MVRSVVCFANEERGEEKCLYKPHPPRHHHLHHLALCSAYLHMNRVCPIEKLLNEAKKREREEAGGGHRINHNRLQSEASFFFLLLRLRRRHRRRLLFFSS